MSSRSYSLRIADVLATSFKTKQNYSRCRYVLTRGNFVCCSECCLIFRERFALNDSWRIRTDCLNLSDRFLHCDSCEKRIPVARWWLWLRLSIVAVARVSLSAALSMASKSSVYYKQNPKARAKKNAYQRKRNKTEENREYRAELNAERRRRGIYGKGGKDVSHKKDGGMILEHRSKNRARNGANGKSTKK